MILLWLAVLGISGHADTLQSKFRMELSLRLEKRGMSLERLEREKNLSVSLVDHGADGTPTASINGREIMCSASMGKWACAVAAAQLISEGRLKLSDSWEGVSEGRTVTRGDLNAMMQASDNPSAHRVCRVVNEIASPGFQSGKVSCYSNTLMVELGVPPFGVVNGNLFNGGASFSCVADDVRRGNESLARKTSNVGTTEGFAKLLGVVRSRPEWQAYDWIAFNPSHQGRSFDGVQQVARNRFFQAFGCNLKGPDCPIKRRKTGSFAAKNADYCNNDSASIEGEGKKFDLVLMCNEKSKNFCGQEIFDDVASAAMAATVTVDQKNGRKLLPAPQWGAQ